VNAGIIVVWGVRERREEGGACLQMGANTVENLLVLRAATLGTAYCCTGFLSQMTVAVVDTGAHTRRKVLPIFTHTGWNMPK
jgi:hypothetical protein